ncbi:TetR/AcrR family transcriptional regulator [Cystobacter ferrugineus]|uniref:TetR family transcriptional regulator n=1 Tax=Cystobacter ferrugineus TaxID=83449 RepID=A0A1L9BHZ8_9BACT|nr:TetR/AcrR family transcriptional regulator [Cystobacter ferrugineus]OJH41836.1 TetR family transcriptional regulator [Cystobacter ferrugineus]
MATRRPARREKTPRAPRSPSPTSSRRRSPEQAREAILEAAEPLLRERGPDGVGLQAVARAAGVSHALVTHYFGTYEALVGEVFQRRARLLADGFWRGMLESREPPDTGQWLELFSPILQDEGNVRLMAWALLTGRGEHLSLGQGLRRVMDVLEAQVDRVATVQGQPPPSREALEMTLLVGLCAAQGYTLARHLLLPGLGRTEDAQADTRFRAVLSALLDAALGLEPPRGR